MDVLFEDPLLRLTLDRAAGLVRYERTEVPFSSLADVKRVHDRCFEAALGVPRGVYAFLLDVRRAPPRNDEAYEAAIEGYVGRLMLHFRRHAVLVKTAAGRLQVIRLEKRAGRTDAAVFLDEAQALAYLAARS